MSERNGTLIVSLDFELFWGMLDVCPLDRYRDHVLGGRAAIPQLLKLFEKHNIHATWAAVGFLFGDNQGEIEQFFPPENLRPSYKKPGLSPYGYEIPQGEEDCFFCPDLLRQISGIPGQEIGSHTFCHYYCREKGQTAAQFAADMAAAKAIAEKKGFCLTSVILPRNQAEPEYTQVLGELGFTAYRDEENDWIHEKIKYFPLLRLLRLIDVYLPLTGLGGYVPKKENGIWNLTGSRMFKPIVKSFRFLEPVKLWRIKSQMHHAAKHGLTFHLWWHPHNLGVMTQANLNQLEEIFRYYEFLHEKYGMQSLNMQEAANA